MMIQPPRSSQSHLRPALGPQRRGSRGGRRRGTGRPGGRCCSTGTAWPEPGGTVPACSLAGPMALEVRVILALTIILIL
jgi:hypothetical protein